ncbi:CGNR zinc finger domain-containing protein [Planococcus sp. A6]|uniref:CGNR zinc finger domain-containing protein n=1 Tax=Planococcus sp. A6 TaxID=2992760 RepID=UPI00237AD267|nr:CGNR zinc finger domain-containing protein [Planococcus sp. A6]MDE0582578.1 CGNR zinc finger domain-containing protein [Planococcus sp. A6]
MDGKIETQYPYLSDYLFLNLLNTTKRQRSKRMDFLVDNGGVEEWLKLMQQLKLLDFRQVEKLKELPIDASELQDFRVRWRGHLSQLEISEYPLESLAQYVKQVPLYFDSQLTPIPSVGGTAGLLSLVSFEMLRGAKEDLFEKVKKCGSAPCYSFFVDVSGKRKWCSMEVCGNREKAKKQYLKKKDSQAQQQQ